MPSWRKIFPTTRGRKKKWCEGRIRILLLCLIDPYPRRATSSETRRLLLLEMFNSKDRLEILLLCLIVSYPCRKFWNYNRRLLETGCFSRYPALQLHYYTHHHTTVKVKVCVHFTYIFVRRHLYLLLCFAVLNGAQTICNCRQKIKSLKFR